MEKENAELRDRLEKENALLREQLDASRSGLQVGFYPSIPQHEKKISDIMMIIGSRCIIFVFL